MTSRQPQNTNGSDAERPGLLRFTRRAEEKGPSQASGASPRVYGDCRDYYLTAPIRCYGDPRDIYLA